MPPVCVRPSIAGGGGRGGGDDAVLWEKVWPDIVDDLTLCLCAGIF